jgi:hypothetical protein
MIRTAKKPATVQRTIWTITIERTPQKGILPLEFRA